MAELVVVVVFVMGLSVSEVFCVACRICRPACGSRLGDRSGYVLLVGIHHHQPRLENNTL